MYRQGSELVGTADLPVVLRYGSTWIVLIELPRVEANNKAFFIN